MDFFSIVCGAASLLWLAAGALAVEDRWRQRRLTKKSEEALDRLLEEVFDFRFDGYAKAQGAETVLPDTIHSIENWLKEEMDE